MSYSGIRIKEGVSMTIIADWLLACSILLYSYRGNIGALTAIFSFIVRFSTGKLKYAKTSNLQKAWIGFILVFAITDYLIRNINFEFYAFVGYIIAILCIVFLEAENIERLFKYVYRFSIFVAFTVILQFVFPSIFKQIARIVMPINVYSSIVRREASGYITGLTREVSYTALFLTFGLIYTFYKSKSRDKYIICIFWMVLLFVSGKKSQPLFAVIAILLGTYFQSKNIGKHMKTIFKIILVILVLICAYPIWSKISVLSRIVFFIESLSTGVDFIGLTSGRIVIYARALELWHQNKMLGIGWENFRNIGAYGSSEYTTWFNGFDIHNCYLQILCETGIIGLVLFAILFIITTVNIIKMLRIQSKTNDNIKLAATYYCFFWLLALSEPSFYTDAYVIMLFVMISFIFNKKTFGQNVYAE